MGLYKTEAVVLGYRVLGEADKILTLFSPDKGKIHAVAKGVRRPRSSLLGGTQLFTHSSFLIAQGRNLDTISQCEIIESFSSLRATLEHMAYGLYFTELIRVSTPLEEKNRKLFNFLLKTQKMLPAWPDPEVLKFIYELKLMALQGFAPELFCCVGCGGKLSGRIRFSPASGGVICEKCRGFSGIAISPEVLTVLRRFLRCTYEELCQLKVKESLKSPISNVLRAFVEHHIDRKLKALDFIRDVRSLDTNNG